MCDVVHDVVVPPSVSALVKVHLAAVQDVVGGFLVATVGTFVTWTFAPPLRVCFGGKSIKASIDDELHCSAGQVVDVGVPGDIISGCCC